MALPGEKVDLKKLKSELPIFKEAYLKRQQKSEEELDKFIEITQNSNMIYTPNITKHDPNLPWLPLNLFERKEEWGGYHPAPEFPQFENKE